MRSPFWALSLLLHALLYGLLFHLLTFERPPDGVPTSISADFQLDDEIREFDELPESFDTVIDPEPLSAPDFRAGLPDEQTHEPHRIDLEASTREAFDSGDAAIAGGGLGELGFGEDVWSTDFGRQVRHLRSKGLDVVFLFDSTSSMSGALGEAKQSIGWMVRVLQTLVPSFRLGIATYRDYGDEYVVRVENLTDERYRLMTFLDGIRAAGGGDIEEAVLAGIEECTERFAWSAGSQRVIVLIGDAAPHPDEERDLLRRARHFRASGGTIHTLVTHRKSSKTSASEKDAIRTFASIANAGGGSAATLDSAGDLVRELLVLSFGKSWRAEIESAYERVLRRSGWRDQIIDRLEKAGNGSALARKLRIGPVYPGLVEALVRSRDPDTTARVLEVLQDDGLPEDNRWAGLYVLLRRLGISLERLPKDPEPVLQELQERHRARVKAGRAR